MLKTHIFLEKM